MSAWIAVLAKRTPYAGFALFAIVAGFQQTTPPRRSIDRERRARSIMPCAYSGSRRYPSRRFRPGITSFRQ